MPATGDLNDTQRDILIRLAGAATQAADAPEVQSLRASAKRMGTDDRANMFRLLIAAPVKQLSDLARAKSEDGLVGSVPGAVQALK